MESIENGLQAGVEAAVACPAPGGIYAAMAQVMAGIAPIAKEKEMRAETVKYSYRGIDDVYNALQPLFAKAGIFVLPHCVDRVQSSTDGRYVRVLLRMRYTFCHKDGSSLSCEVIGEALDKSDKATNKAMSIAIKYALFQIFCIPTQEMADPDSERIEPERAEPAPANERRMEPERKRREASRRQSPRGDIRELFYETFKQSLQTDARRFFSDVSAFLGSNIHSLSDMSDKEMEYYLTATQDNQTF